MPKISKPDMSNVWAEGGSVAVVPSEKISQGWVVEIPPCEQMNFVQNRQDAGIAYILQQGIPEWDSSTEYQSATSYIQFDNVVYKAIGTSTNKPPTTFPEFWEQAFDVSGSAQSVQDQLDAIEADPDPFEQYLLEVDAARYGIMVDLEDGNSLTSTNLNVITDGMWQFDTTCANKPFASGKLVQNTSGSVVYQFVESLSEGTATRTATSGVWTDWRYAVSSSVAFDLSTLQTQVTALVAAIERSKIKVGDLFLTTIDFLAPSEVTAHLGYGTWARYAEGYALVGRNTSTAPFFPEWTSKINEGYGEYTHGLTVNQLPSHDHTVQISSDSNSVSVVNETHGLSTNPNNIQTSAVPIGSTGLGERFEIVQPSIVVGIWYRVG